MSITINDNFNAAFPKPIDNRFGPFVNVATALAAIPSWERYLGLTAAIGTTTIVEYWFSGGILDANFVVKNEQTIVAIDVQVDAANFDNILNPTDSNVQLALETLDSHTHTFEQITDKPTTLAGYGITNPIVETTGSYANPPWITSIDFQKITNVPNYENLSIAYAIALG